MDVLVSGLRVSDVDGMGVLLPESNDVRSTRTLVTSLRPWIRRSTMIISAWLLRTSSKFRGQEFEEIYKNIGSLKTPKQVRISPITKKSLQ